jgi:hypothetical protein
MKDIHVTKDYDSAEFGRGKGLRSVTVSVRLDPRLRYFAELAARKQRRTLSSYVEWVIEESLRQNGLHGHSGPTVAEEMSDLWDVDDADRFVKLALKHSDLLTHEEQVRWKLICENGAVWNGAYAGPDQVWTWTISARYVNYQKLREYWDVFCKVARFELDKEHLPSWKMFDDEADDIPF